MEKKGQVTIFIIVAIMLVSAGGLYFVFKDSKVKENSEIPSEIAPIKNFVDSCIESEIEEAVYLIGVGGGYFFPPVLSDERGFTYYFYGGKNYFPSKEEIEERLSRVIESKIYLCVNDFGNFPSYEIEKRGVKVETDIFEEKIVFDINFPLKISKGEETYLLQDFGETSFYVKLGIIHEGIYNLIQEDYYNEEQYCLSCFSELAFENNLTVEFIEGGLENSLFIIRDYNEKYDRTFEYVFAV